ncbi:BglG family transcription antiterminator, partial [Streptococcus uberis]
YLQAFGDYINKVYESSVSDLDFFDFKGNHIDYIFTTVPLSKKYPIPIYEINLFIDTNDILTYKQFFEEGEKNYLLDYYSTNLFLPHLKASTKEDALKQMCQH